MASTSDAQAQTQAAQTEAKAAQVALAEVSSRSDRLQQELSSSCGAVQEAQGQAREAEVRLRWAVGGGKGREAQWP